MTGTYAAGGGIWAFLRGRRGAEPSMQVKVDEEFWEALRHHTDSRGRGAPRAVMLVVAALIGDDEIRASWADFESVDTTTTWKVFVVTAGFARTADWHQGQQVCIWRGTVYKLGGQGSGASPIFLGEITGELAGKGEWKKPGASMVTKCVPKEEADYEY
ncbi:hypothetical protein MSM1_20095 [Mycobacterium sp. SM1]|uniref:hypothetical protein n=1 Tax=Mycobacterium sp. SM1 TaxID=2816243 RepID=UPI001BCE02DC|nr:hypothetical protein [Mycobacterium sp. SM1]MBS4730524.1 hypothetical protein [Mycobacterium sp. SM1]